jgi:single-strand DNA-binding protein
MGAQLNRAEVIGNLGFDPETKQAGATTVTRLRIATTRKWKNKETGVVESETEWHNVTAWGQLGQNAQKYLAKGRLVRVVGRMRASTYDKEGVKMRAFEIVAETVDFLDKAPSAGSTSSGEQWDDQPPAGWGDDR